MKVRKARLAMEKAIADPWAESRNSQARQAANRNDFAEGIRSVQSHAMDLVRDDDQRVRAEDYVAVLAAATGEAALVDSGCIDIERTELIPGQGIFGDAINRVLSGDRTTLENPGPFTVIGILRRHLVPAVVAGEAFEPTLRLYEHVAASVGASPWGSVVVSVPVVHRPRILPLQSAFRMRPFVDAEAERLGFPAAQPVDGEPTVWSRHALCTSALASAISQTASTLEPQIATTLALEVAFGMAKMVPMSMIAFDRSRGETT